VASSNTSIATSDRIATYTTTGSTARVTAVDVDLTYTETIARVTAIDVDLTYTEAGAIVGPDLDLHWRIGEDDQDTRFKWLSPASGNFRASAVPKIASGHKIPVEILVGTDGAISLPSIAVRPSTPSPVVQFPIDDIYFRIWVIPHFMRPQNPALNTDIPFTLWQAWPEPNNLDTITGSGQDGLTLDLTPPRAFFTLEELVVNLQIGPTAPTNISAVFNFNFAV